MTCEQLLAWYAAEPDRLDTPAVSIHRHPPKDDTIQQLLRYDVELRPGDRIYTLSQSAGRGDYRSWWVVCREVDGHWVPVYFGGGVMT
ncbi:MAG: hypothetical protein ACIAXF_05100 [Phycisphaerales bacterium JB063]